MGALPSPGKPGFLHLGFHGRVILSTVSIICVIKWFKRRYFHIYTYKVLLSNLVYNLLNVLNTFKSKDIHIIKVM